MPSNNSYEFPTIWLSLSCAILRGGSAQKGYLFQASGLWKGNKSSRSMNEMPQVVPDDIYVMNVLRYANINQMAYGQK